MGTNGKRPLGKLKQMWIDKVKKNLIEIEMQDGEGLVQDRDR